MKNKRRHPRKRAAIPVRIESGDRSLAGSILDISTGGAFVRVEGTMAPGQNITVIMEALSVNEPFAVTGRITSKRSAGVGVVFEHLSKTQRNLLSYLYY